MFTARTSRGSPKQYNERGFGANEARHWKAPESSCALPMEKPCSTGSKHLVGNLSVSIIALRCWALGVVPWQWERIFLGAHALNPKHSFMGVMHAIHTVRSATIQCQTSAPTYSSSICALYLNLNPKPPIHSHRQEHDDPAPGECCDVHAAWQVRTDVVQERRFLMLQVHRLKGSHLVQHLLGLRNVLAGRRVCIDE